MKNVKNQIIKIIMDTIFFMDEDFGEVKMEYSPETKNLVINGELIITNTPEEFDEEMVMYSWDIFKVHHNSYGFVCINYDQIPEMENYYVESY